jgi:NADPH2:quinone reductase
MSSVIDKLRPLYTSLGKVMKAVRVHQFGGPEVLKYEINVPIPKPGPGDILINVKAVGINPVETYIRAGTYARKPSLPTILGNDCAGIVDQVGSDVTTFKPGDRVFTTKTSTGAYAEYTLSPAISVHPLPEVLSFSQGAALSTPYLTAYRALFHRGFARPGETVLVHGASGGVGVAAVQFARANGMRVFGTAGTSEGEHLVKKAGAHAVFNHRKDGYLDEIKQEAGEDGVNVIVENAAHLNLGKDLPILARGGRVAVVGSRGPIEINPRDTMVKEAMISGVMLFNASPKELSEAHAMIQTGVECEWLRPIVGKEFPLEDASVAHTDIITGSGALGKMVLTVD